MTGDLAVTWWGHSSTTIEIGGVRVATDPLLGRRLGHLVRHAPTPAPDATVADLVLVSHLHGDHLHPSSLRRMTAGTVVVPPGGARLASLPRDHTVIEAEPGDRLDVAGLDVEVLPARHDGRRLPLGRTHPALGFRVTDGSRSFWYPGDTGPDAQMSQVDEVDLALVPIGGWGPTLGDDHLDPDDAAAAVAQVGARWAVPVHYGTLWPFGLRHVARANHHHLFVTPSERFAAAMAQGSAEAVVLAHGERAVLGDDR